MIKKLFTLLKLGRKLAKSDALKIATKFNEPPLLVKVLFSILSFSFSQKYVNECARDFKIDFEINSKQIDKLIKKENKWWHEIFKTKLTK